MLERATAAIRQGRDAELRSALRRGASAASPTTTSSIRPSARSRCQLPSEIDIAQAIGRDIDPDAIHRGAARAAGLPRPRRSARPLRDGRRAGGAGPPLFAGRRQRRPPRLRACRLEPARSPAARWTAPTSSSAMRRRRTSPTASRRCAFSSITGSTAPTTRSTRFYARYRDNPLVLDKWFAVQATAPSHAALDRVEALAGHPAFSFKNPNRVYALIRSFAAVQPGRLQPAGRRRLPLRGAASSPTSTGRTPRSPRASRPRSARGGCWSRSGAAQAEARSAEMQQSRAAFARPRRHPDAHARRPERASRLIPAIRTQSAKRAVDKPIPR